MSYLNWHVGMRVVCVDGSPHMHCHAPINKGAVYVIRDIYRDRVGGGIGLRLDGIILPAHPDFGTEFGWRAERFRPIVKRETKIDVFTAMLNPSKQRVEA